MLQNKGGKNSTGTQELLWVQESGFNYSNRSVAEAIVQFSSIFHTPKSFSTAVNNKFMQPHLQKLLQEIVTLQLTESLLEVSGRVWG